MLRVSAECAACMFECERVCVIFQSTFELSFSHRHANTIVRSLAIAFPSEQRKKNSFVFFHILFHPTALKSVE